MNAVIDKPATSNHSEKSLESIVTRFGNPLSPILLDIPHETFSIPNIDGIIGYQLIHNCAVVIGNPICTPENSEDLTLAFQKYCQSKHWSILYFLVTEPFIGWAMKNGSKVLIKAGEEVIINPVNFKANQKLRWKINQSQRTGTIIKEYQKGDTKLANQLNDAFATWLKSKKGPQIHIGDFNAFTEANNRRIFYAKQNEKIIGVLTLSKLNQHKGWVMTSFCALPGSPVGTSEHLISAVLEWLASENCHFVCLGVVSGSNLENITGLSLFSKLLLHTFYKITRWLFRLDAKKRYIDKFHPTGQPTYLCSEKLGLNELFALKTILNVKL